MSKRVNETSEKNLLIVAGEVSGDIYGALLANACQKMVPGIKIFGVGGKRMEKAGVNLLFNSLSLSVVGITEVLSKWGKIKEVFKKLKNFIYNSSLQAVVLIDYPGFNLRLAKVIKEKGIPLLYYVPPQVWAWGKRRVKKIGNLADKIAVILPFEKEWYKEKGYEVEYVGHPLFEVLKNFKKMSLTRKKKEVIIGILPGSRQEEVKRILPVMLATAQLINKKRKVKFVLPLADGIEKNLVEKEIKKWEVPVKIYSGNSHLIIQSSDFLLVSSGTATLEAAYFQTPMVIIYKLSLLSYIVARILVKVPWIGLVNLISGEEVVPEFIQREAKPEKIASQVENILKDKDKIIRIKRKLSNVTNKLSCCDTSYKVAKIVLGLMKEEQNEFCWSKDVP